MSRILFVRIVATVPGKPWLTGMVADMVAGLQARLTEAGVDVAGVEWEGNLSSAFLCGPDRGSLRR